MTIQRRLRVTLLTALCLAMCLCTTAFADTDGTEPKITQQPDQLVLQLGTRWAGVEFELRTDAGVFPAPIVVDETGVLTMDLGGSTTYTLSCINSTVPIPDPPAEQVPDTQQQPDSSAQQPSGQVQQPQEQVPAGEPAGVPIAPMVVFFIGLACGIGGLVALYFAKRRRMRSSTDRQKPPQTEIQSPRLRWAKKWRKPRQNCVFSLTICRHPVIISL